MRLRSRRSIQKPEVMIIPMIDIMFFLLVFFMLSTLYMVNIKTIPVSMPKTENAQMQPHINYLVTVNKNGELYLEDKVIDEKSLIAKAQEENKKNPKFAVVIRADKDVNYAQLMALLDDFKSAGVFRLGLASEKK